MEPSVSTPLKSIRKRAGPTTRKRPKPALPISECNGTLVVRLKLVQHELKLVRQELGRRRAPTLRITSMLMDLEAIQRGVEVGNYGTETESYVGPKQAL